MSCIYKSLFQIGLYFELKMCKKCWLFMRMNAIILIFLWTILSIFQILIVPLVACSTTQKDPQNWFEIIKMCLLF